MRETLQTVLVDEIAKRGEAGPEARDEDATIVPLSTPTISKNTRYSCSTIVPLRTHTISKNTRYACKIASVFNGVT